MRTMTVLTVFLLVQLLGTAGEADAETADSVQGRRVSPQPVVDSHSTLDSTVLTLPRHNDTIWVDTVAEMLSYAMPDYPPMAEQSGTEGMAWIKVLVGTDGSVWDSGIWRSSGSVLLDLAALQEAPRCKFKPAIRCGRPVPMWVTYKVDFTLPGKKSKRKKQLSFIVNSRTDTVVSTLWEDISETSAPPDVPVQTPEVLQAVSDPNDSAQSQEFGILILHETDNTRRGKQKALVLIDGGCAKGLTVGMKGVIWDHSEGKPIKLANVELSDVQAFESLCLVESLRRKIVTTRHRVTFDQPPLTLTELLSRAEQYYTSGLREQALSCYEELSGLADSNALVKSRLEELHRVRWFREDPKTMVDSIRIQKQFPAWLKVAEAYIRLDKASGARRYVDKILTIDSTNQAASELGIALSASEDCKLDMKVLFLGSKDTSGIDRLPRITSVGYALPRIPPGDYYSEWYPRNKKEPDSVWIRALVGSKGQVLRAEVHSSSGMRELDSAAVEAAFETKFESGILCGRPMAMWVKWKVEFRREAS